MRHLLSATGLLGALCLILGAEPQVGLAQTLRGVVVEEGSDAPVAGAFLVVVDSTGTLCSKTLSSDSGRFLLRAPGRGTYRLRVDRIGYASSLSEPIQIEHAEVVGIRLVASPEPVRLSEVQVEVGGPRRCDVLPHEGIEVHRVWEEARKALAAVVWTGQQQYYRFDAVEFERDLDPDGRPRGETRYEEVRYYGRHPFRSIPARDLALGGFVRFRPSGASYYGPDADVLLSPEFLAGHCFRLVRAGSGPAALLGLEFEPVSRSRIPDIAGTLWLDPASAELRNLEYGYRNIDLGVDTSLLGGSIEFHGLPSGAWIVRRWAIRAPVLGWRSAGPSLRGRSTRRRILAAIEEGGGHVTAVYVTSRLIGVSSADTLAVRPPPDSLIVRFPLPE